MFKELKISCTSYERSCIVGVEHGVWCDKNWIARKL